MKYDDDGRLRAINPENGFFGVAPGTGWNDTPNAYAGAREGSHLHQHRKWVEPQLADRAQCGGGRFGGHRRAHEDAVLPVESLTDQRNDGGSAAAEQKRIDRNAGRSSHSGAIDGTCVAASVKREFGCAAGWSASGVPPMCRHRP